MDSSSSSSSLTITREEFNAFHKFDRALFTRLLSSLRRDIPQSFQVMCFLIYLEKNVPMSNLIFDLVSLPDLFINTVVDEVVTCLRCLTYDYFPAFVASSGNINALSIPWIRRTTRDHLTLGVIHQKREDILLEMKKHLTSVCYPAFEDICVRFDTSSQFFRAQQERTNHVQGTNNVVVRRQQVTAEDMCVFLTFSRGYPVSEAEVHAYFTRIYGDIIEAIQMDMGGVGGSGQALYATMVLRSASMIPEIVNNEGCTTKFIINGKHVWARKFFPSPKSNSNLFPSSFGGVYL